MRHSGFGPMLGLALSAAACSAVTAGPTVAAPEAVHLLESSPGRTRFEVIVPEARLASADASEGLQSLELDGYESVGRPGGAALPVRVVLVAVPPSGDVRLSADALEPLTRDGVQLAAVAWQSRDGEEVAPPEPAAAAAREPTGVAGRASPSGLAGARAELLDVSWMREQRVARVAIRPAEYSASARRLTSWGRIEVDVETPAGGGLLRAAPPDSDAFESIYRASLVNYEQGRAWRMKPGDPRRTVLGAVMGVTQVPDTSVFVGRRWLKIAIPKAGLYRLPFRQFRRFAPFDDDTTTSVDSLRMFTWPGLPVMPEASYCDECDYDEVPIGIVDGGDGKLNQDEDAIYFYALGPSDWANHFDATQPDTVFVNDPYATRSYYYLTISTAAQPVGGVRKRIATRSGAVHVDGDETTPATFPARIHQELDIVYYPDAWPGFSSYAWDKWYWTRLSAGASFSATSSAPQADTLQVARLRARLWNLSVPLCVNPEATVSVSWNSASIGQFSWDGFTGYTVDTPLGSLKSAGNSIRITATSLPCTQQQLGVSWFDLFYARRLVPVSEALEFGPPAGGGRMLYRVAPFTLAAPPRVFEVSDPVSPVEITDLDYTTTPQGHELAFESQDDGRQRYLALADTAMLSVAPGDVSSAAGTSVDNLRSHTWEAKYLVVYYDEFKLAAETLADWRRTHDGFSTKTVSVSAIYDQFSGGRTDPTAIRNFLHAAYFNWTTPPEYVTFLGDASYDFKNITGQAPTGQPGSPLPTYENGFESTSFRQFTTDDWLLNVDTPNIVVPDFLGGRLPVPDATTAMDVVRDKILKYDRSAPLELYRDRVMLVADDNEQGSAGDSLYWTHLAQTTQLDTLYTPSSMDRVYVYLHTYPDGAGDTKPGARADILSNLNGTGVAVFNYIGHGSPFKLSDESVFLDTDAGALVNADRLPLFVAASCDVGRFSDPAFPSLGERLVVRTEGGAIGVISATELALSGANAGLNRTVFERLFSRASGGRMSGRVAEALAAAKLGGSNSQKYQLMGDAALRLNLPRDWVELTVRDDQERDTTAIQQGHRMTFSGRVLDQPGGDPVVVDGTADVLVEDSAPRLQAPPCVVGRPTCTRPYYLFRAGPVFRGTATVRGGVIQGEFVVPIEARPGDRGRIRVYLTGTQAGQSIRSDAVGDLRLRVAQGSSTFADDAGPEIRLSFPNGATRVRPDAMLKIDLTDPSGILITGHARQNSIIVTVDGNTTSRADVTGSFRYAEGSYQSGSASFTLPNLPEGPHRVAVSAADNLAAGLTAGHHRTQATIEFDVAQAPPLRIQDAYLFPNPAASKGRYSGGRFIADIDGGPADVLLRIYTSAGRLVRSLRAAALEGQLQLPWDGRDAEGAGLANGVYLFKIQASTEGVSGSGGVTQTAHSEGRFVILSP